MLDSHPWAAGFGLLALTLSGCTTAPPSPLAQDHPASIHAPAAPVQTQPSALTAYRDFGAAPPTAETPAMDHSMHEQHQHSAPGTQQDDKEGEHAHH